MRLPAMGPHRVPNQRGASARESPAGTECAAAGRTRFPNGKFPGFSTTAIR